MSQVIICTTYVVLQCSKTDKNNKFDKMIEFKNMIKF